MKPLKNSSIKLNCDLGESFGAWQMGLDAQVMPLIDQANVACGFHAGDPTVLVNTLNLAKQHQVQIGAHPSYDDKQGFGRRSVKMNADELKHLLWYQIAAVDGVAKSLGLELSYIKPHGALYNDMMASPALLDTVMQAVASYHKPLKLMLLATASATEHKQLAKGYQLELLFEAFADRRYKNDGSLTPRSQAGSVLDHQSALAQVQQLLQNGTVQSDTGDSVVIQADTLCVHGDNPQAVALVQSIRQLLGSR
ncbi:5-oxoprolinase subunit PxpA [Rheinheimera sp.]|uniref:5-oxoprolinase subunit PxpA n=1 Tax=Rheinheimera sp. TaxID=1869214 RepID=UPI0026199E53|nr:5-oxoprolinase subunit PxpA [Rheinheimera sp.]MCA1929646.1 5-oxoprolinase subunit PxpA [Rheinheimera sp.]